MGIGRGSPQPQHGAQGPGEWAGSTQEPGAGGARLQPQGEGREPVTVFLSPGPQGHHIVPTAHPAPALPSSSPPATGRPGRPLSRAGPCCQASPARPSEGSLPASFGLEDQFPRCQSYSAPRSLVAPALPPHRLSRVSDEATGLKVALTAACGPPTVCWTGRTQRGAGKHPVRTWGDSGRRRWVGRSDALLPPHLTGRAGAHGPHSAAASVAPRPRG